MGGDVQVWAQGQGLIQPALADVAPGADGVVDDFDVHAAGP